MPSDPTISNRPADFGSPAEGPIWTCVGVYEDGMQAAILYVHAPHVGGVLDTIDGAIQTERLSYSFTPVAIFKGALEEAH